MSHQQSQPQSQSQSQLHQHQQQQQQGFFSQTSSSQTSDTIPVRLFEISEISPFSQSESTSNSISTPIVISPNGFDNSNIGSNNSSNGTLRGEEEEERKRVECPVCGEFIERTKNAIDNHRTSVLCCTRIEKVQLSSSGASLFDAFDRIPQVPIGKSINGKNPRMFDVICCSFFLLLSLF